MGTFDPRRTGHTLRRGGVAALRIGLRVSDSTIHLQVSGDLDATGADTLRASVDAIIGADRLRRIVIDLSAATVCDATVRAALRACGNQAARRGIVCEVITTGRQPN